MFWKKFKYILCLIDVLFYSELQHQNNFKFTNHMFIFYINTIIIFGNIMKSGLDK